MSFGWDSFNNLVKDDKGNYLKLGWESISGATLFGIELLQQWLVRFSVL